jgi:putative ABC transport system permease protein
MTNTWPAAATAWCAWPAAASSRIDDVNLALRFFLRDWRAGELTALALALAVAVTSVTSVGFFADRVRQALTLNAHQLLGGDLLVTADQPLPDAFPDEAARRGLRVAEGLGFASMARSPDGAQLAAVKAVGPGYPLRGRLRIAESADLAGDETGRGPSVGSVWVDPRFVSLTGIRVGESLELGDARLIVAAILTHEPDRGLAFFNLAPRVMLHRDDVPRTGLIQPGSRIKYQLYVAGESKAIAAYRSWLQARLGRGQQVQGLEDASPEVRSGLDRAQTFLGLAALLAVVLAAVAVHLAARRYVERHYDGYAVMRCLGAHQRRLVGLFGGQFLLLGGLAGALGCLLGYGAQAFIGLLLGDLLAADLPGPSPLPALQGVITGYVLLLGFALPPLLQLQRVPALRVLRREAGAPGTRPLLAYAAGLATLAALLVWHTGDPKLAGHALGGFLAAIALFALVSLLTLRLAAWGGRWTGFAWRYGLANLHRRWAANTVQIVALALGITAILLLAITRGDLIDAWRAKTPTDAPNRFLLNVQPDQREAVLDFFRENGLPAPKLYPMVRGRLVAINDRPVGPDDFQEDRARRLVEREFNLSYMSELPAHNAVLSGRWFGTSETDALSIEEGIAKTLGIRLGDRLTWSVAGEAFSASITSVRKLDWDSMQVNFFVIATPGQLADFPASYITSFRLHSGQAGTMTQLVRAFPNLTVIDVTAALDQALALTERMIGAVQFVFLFALGAGILVLYTALLSTQGERIREAALMRALGASRKQVAAAQRSEYAAIGLLSGLLASAGTAFIGGMLALRVFEFPSYAPDPWIWAAGPALGLLCVAFNAWLGVRAALDAPPLLVLREA